jgi:WD40 repeat protein
VVVTNPLNELGSAIQKRQALVLVGAGVSIGATAGRPAMKVEGLENSVPVASWPGLLYHGVAYCETWVKPKERWGAIVRDEIGLGELESLVSAATKIENRLGAPGGGLYKKWLRESVGSLEASNRATIEAIVALGVPIATTNYDKLIEQVTGWPSITWKKGNEVERVLGGESQAVIHLHGYWEDSDSVVLGHRSYDEVVRDPNAQALLRAMFAVRTVLLVGFGAGLDDPNFGPLITWIRRAFEGSEKPRFRLKLQSESGDPRAEYPVVPLDYGAEHADLAPFLRSLAPSQDVHPPPPSPRAGVPKFLINSPRNLGVVGVVGFVGRDEELKRLHAALSGSGAGPVGIRPWGSAHAAGLIGMGGIGKTQLAVEYSYRQHEAGTYPDGIFWIYAAEPLNQGFARLARDLGLATADQAVDQQVRSAFEALAGWKQALLVLDNLEDPGILNRPIISGCIPVGLPCRLLFTTRRRDLGGFQPVEVTVLPEGPALQLLLRHSNRQRAVDPGHPDHEAAVAITRMLGRLPLALELAGVYLEKWSHADKPGFVSLPGYREQLRTKGRLATVDVGAKTLSDNELQSIHQDAVEVTLRQQWDALEGEDARQLLLVAGQLSEAAVLPNARLGLLAGVSARRDDGEGPSSLDEALRRLEVDCLVEKLEREQVRLHPLVREFAERLLQGEERSAFRVACTGRMAAAYEDYATVEEQARTRPGIAPLEEDLLTALGFCPADDLSVRPRLQSLLRLLQRESHHLRAWDPTGAPVLFPQQIRNRAVLQSVAPLVQGAEARLVALGQGHALLRWRATRESPALVRTLSGHRGLVKALAVTGDGRVVSGSDDGTVKVWDLASGQELRTLSGHGGWVMAVAVTGDGRVVSGSSDGTLKMWDLERGEELRTLSGHGGGFRALAVTGDGRVVSGSEDGTVKLWDLTSGEEPRTLSGHDGGVWALAVTGDGRVVSGSRDGTVTVWDLTSGQELRTLPGHGGGVSAVAVTGDGRVVSGSEDGTVKLWDLTSSEEPRTLSGHGGGVWALAVTGDGRVVSGSSDGTVKVWDLTSGEEPRTLAGHGGWVNGLAVTGDGRVVSGSSDGTVKVWDLASVPEPRTLSGHGGGVNALALTGDGRVVSGSDDRTVKAWDLTSGQELRTLSGHRGDVMALALTGDGRVVSGSDYGTVWVWDLEGGQELRTLSSHGGWVWALAVTGEGRVVSGSEDGTVKVWDLKSGREPRTLSGHGGWVRALAVTGEGRVVSGSEDGTVKVWDLKSGRELRTLSGHGGWVRALVVTGDGHVVSGSKNGTVTVWDLESGEELRTISGHGGGVRALGVTGDGRVVSGSDDGTLKVWDLSRGACLATVPLDSSPEALALEAGPEGTVLVVGEASGAVSCYRLILP